MPQVAIYVKDPPAPRHDIISKEEQEATCREYCSGSQFTVSAVFADPPGSTEKFDELLALATSAEVPFDAIVVWKTSRITISLEDTIALRDRLRRVGTKLLSVTERAPAD